MESSMSYIEFVPVAVAAVIVVVRTYLLSSNTVRNEAAAKNDLMQIPA
jgi:hypothetical protein